MSGSVKTGSIEAPVAGPGAVAGSEDGGGRSLAQRAGLVSAMTLVSRLFGLAREQAFAALLGAGFYADAFNAAFRIPNLLRDLFAEGALSAAFVPTYARAMAEGGRERAFQLASRLLTLLALALSVLVLLGFAFTDPLVGLLAPGFEATPGKRELTITLTRVMLPFLPLVSFAALAMGMLNAHGRFGMPALAPAVFNAVTIVWAVGLWVAGFGPAAVAMGWAIGTMLGGAAQFLIQWPGLRRVGWRYRPELALRDPGIRAVGRLMAPATIGLAAVQLNFFVNTNFASHEPGAVSWLQYAFRLVYLPIGLFGVAVGTVVTADFAQRAAAGDLQGIRETLRRALHMLAFLTIPATLGLVILREPIVRLLYERGRFLAADTQNTAVAVACLSLGLVAYTGVKVLAPAFYSLGAPRIPLLASACAVATNVLFIFSFHARLGFRAIALGTALGSLANVAVLLIAFERRVSGLLETLRSGRVARVVLAAGVMAPAAWGCARLLDQWIGARGLPAQLVTGLVPVAVGGGVYLAAARALRLPEMEMVRRLIRRGGP